MKAIRSFVVISGVLLFQSPCGEVVMKAHLQILWLSNSALQKVSVPLRGSGDERVLVVLQSLKLFGQFQSPCGEVVMKVQYEINMFGQKYLFQSPCGEVVMKECTWINGTASCTCCFSPLAGKW